MANVFKHHRQVQPTAASEAHAFVEPWDPRLGLAIGGGAQGGLTLGMAGPTAMTMQSIERDRCAVVGCARPREDPIHWPAESKDDPPDWG